MVGLHHAALRHRHQGTNGREPPPLALVSFGRGLQCNASALFVSRASLWAELRAGDLSPDVVSRSARFATTSCVFDFCASLRAELRAVVFFGGARVRLVALARFAAATGSGAFGTVGFTGSGFGLPGSGFGFTGSGAFGGAVGFAGAGFGLTGSGAFGGTAGLAGAGFGVVGVVPPDRPEPIVPLDPLPSFHDMLPFLDGSAATGM